MIFSAPAWWIGHRGAGRMRHCIPVSGYVCCVVVFVVASGDVEWFHVPNRSLVLGLSSYILSRNASSMTKETNWFS